MGRAVGVLAVVTEAAAVVTGAAGAAIVGGLSFPIRVVLFALSVVGERGTGLGVGHTFTTTSGLRIQRCK